MIYLALACSGLVIVARCSYLIGRQVQRTEDEAEWPDKEIDRLHELSIRCNCPMCRLQEFRNGDIARGDKMTPVELIAANRKAHMFVYPGWAGKHKMRHTIGRSDCLVCGRVFGDYSFNYLNDCPGPDYSNDEAAQMRLQVALWQAGYDVSLRQPKHNDGLPWGILAEDGPVYGLTLLEAFAHIVTTPAV